jgi:pimeloyl-ACP methyl ester carboxylesterase
MMLNAHNIPRVDISLSKEARMPVLDRDGVGIYYEDHGTGPAILLSHGYGATCRMWDRQVAEFEDRYRIILWDLRGHGQSASPDDPAAYSEALCIDDMAALLHACRIERAIVGGLSLGGVVSLAFHLAHPEMVRALMLFDTGPGFRNPEARAAWNDRAAARAAALEAEGLAALGHGEEIQRARHHSAAGLAHAARGMLAQQGDHLINSLDKIAVPTLVLVGANDRNFLAAADYMAKKIPGARRVTIPDAGHASNIDQPQRFDHAVAKFLAGLE